MRHPSVDVGTTQAASQCAAQLIDVAPLTVRFIRGQMRTQMPGLTMSQFRAMAFLYRRSGCALRELADHLGVRAATCSSLVDRLVQRGLVDRRTNISNRRQVTLALTRSGVTHVESARDVARGRTAKLLSALPDRTLRSLARNLEILADVFSRTQEQAR